jgi:magnesium chelatase subunit H
MKRIVLIAGFESFNADLYRQAAAAAQARCADLEIQVFSDRDLAAKPEVVEAALQGADVFFGSLLFDYDQVLWDLSCLSLSLWVKYKTCATG